MSSYVDGYVLVVPKKLLAEYVEMAKRSATVWIDHGALDYKECVGQDLTPDEGRYPFPLPYKMKNDETIVFSYVVFRSREHRDAVNKKVMNDPRLKADMDREDIPFDFKRFSYGGFETVVEASATTQ